MIVSGVSLLFGTALHLDHRGVVVVVLLVDHLQKAKRDRRHRTTSYEQAERFGGFGGNREPTR